MGPALQQILEQTLPQMRLEWFHYFKVFFKTRSGEERGFVEDTESTVNYTSPGSVHPASGIHEFSLYLPKGYLITRRYSEQWQLLHCCYILILIGCGRELGPGEVYVFHISR